MTINLEIIRNDVTRRHKTTASIKYIHLAASVYKYLQITSKLAKEEMESYASAGAIAEEVIAAIKTVFAFGGQQKELDRYGVHLDTAYKNNTKRVLMTGASNGVVWFFMYASYALSFYFGITFILEERGLPEEEITYTPGTMIIVTFGVAASLDLRSSLSVFRSSSPPS